MWLLPKQASNEAPKFLKQINEVWIQACNKCNSYGSDLVESILEPKAWLYVYYAEFTSSVGMLLVNLLRYVSLHVSGVDVSDMYTCPPTGNTAQF